MKPQEFQFLLACLRSRPDTQSIKRFITEGLDWQILLNSAARHGVRPALLRTLKLVSWDSVPDAVKDQLVRFNQANAHKNLIFTAELLRLLDIFQENEIPIVAFKGPILAASVYRDL